MHRLRTVTSLDGSAVAGHHAMPAALLFSLSVQMYRKSYCTTSGVEDVSGGGVVHFSKMLKFLNLSSCVIGKAQVSHTFRQVML